MAGLALLIGSLSGCSGDDPAPGPREDPPAEVATPAPLATSTKVVNVAGRLPKARRDAVGEQVTAVVDAWFDDAFVGGEFPRTVGEEAWGGFTPDAAKKARKDKKLTSAAAVSEQVESIAADRRVVRNDVLAHKGRAQGVTARVLLRYETTGEVESTFLVRGRVMLSPAKGGWKIFGYDLTQEER
ncbi:hypothetical protein [Nocardioides gilvus]|uniref:hypothetical protein n=1 Tax=Nocardioides gilvus TaxID=1735589 RepID=UPI000D74AC85|nr:hypothetical protein [Nocardioides gilvus]